MTRLDKIPAISIRQRRELAEFFGFESRNKYEVTLPDRTPLLFIAEQSKGFLGMIGRQMLGHWRSFELQFFTPDRQPMMKAVHPFRFFFKRLELIDGQGRLIGILQQRFAIFSKKFDILAPDGQVWFEMKSPFWKIWTFPFRRNGQEVAVLSKKFSGVFTEMMTDKDNFEVKFADPSLGNNERLMMLAAAIFVDLIYFEKKANS